MKLEALEPGDRLFEYLRSKHGATRGTWIGGWEVIVLDVNRDGGRFTVRGTVSGRTETFGISDLKRFRRKPIAAATGRKP